MPFHSHISSRPFAILWHNSSLFRTLRCTSHTPTLLPSATLAASLHTSTILSKSKIANHAICAPLIKLISEDGRPLGEHKLQQVLSTLDLSTYELQQVAFEPVPRCRIVRKQPYVSHARAKASQPTHSVTKEVQIRQAIEPHDAQVKLQQIRRFLEKGYRVQLKFMLRRADEKEYEVFQNIVQQVEKDIPCKVSHPKMMERKTLSVTFQSKNGGENQKKQVENEELVD